MRAVQNQEWMQRMPGKRQGSATMTRGLGQRLNLLSCTTLRWLSELPVPQWRRLLGLSVQLSKDCLDA